MVPANRRSSLGNDFCNNYCHRVWLGNSNISLKDVVKSLWISTRRDFILTIFLWMQGQVTAAVGVPEVPRNASI